MKNLYQRFIKDAPIQAYSHPMVAPVPRGFKGGLIVDADDEQAQKLRHSRYFGPVDQFDSGLRPKQYLEGRYILAGPIYGHFGHFMSEMVHRIVPSLEQADGRKWLFVGIKDDPLLNQSSQKPKFFLEVLQFCGIDISDVRVINEDVVVEDLFVSEQGSDFGGGPRAGYTDMLGHHADRRFEELNVDPINIGSVYVSRSSLNRNGTFVGEGYLENILREEGVRIVSPEKLSFIEQMNTYRSAKSIVFPEGSACHGVELLGSNALDNCCLLIRRHNHREIFSRVLQPRSRHFEIFDSSANLGSLRGPPGGIPWDHTGVSLFNINVLVTSLQKQGIAKLATFDPKAFVNAALIDIDRYLGESFRAGQLTSLEDARSVYERFDATLDEMSLPRPR